jgi:hypothetical protein
MLWVNNLMASLPRVQEDSILAMVGLPRDFLVLDLKDPSQDLDNLSSLVDWIRIKCLAQSRSLKMIKETEEVCSRQLSVVEFLH